MDRNTFVFYKDWMDAIRGLPDDIRLDIYESVIEYATTGKVRGLKPMANIAFNFIKTTIDRDTEKYVSIAERNRNNGTKGGRPKNPEKPKKPSGLFGNPEKPKKADSVSDSDSVIVSVNENELKKGKNASRFVPPSLDEISIFISDNNYAVDPEGFLNFYASKGWMVGKNKMKDWKASVRTWHQKNRDSHNVAAPERIYSYEDVCKLCIDEKKFKMEDFEVIPSEKRKKDWRLKQARV